MEPKVPPPRKARTMSGLWTNPSCNRTLRGPSTRPAPALQGTARHAGACRNPPPLATTRSTAA